MDTWASATEIAAAVAAGKRTAVEVVETTLRRIAERDKTLNAFTVVTRERALAKARTIDAARASGRPLGLLAGVPFAVKNLFDVAGIATLAGSKINRDRPPAGADATLIARLEAAGAILVGALNMGEYAYDFTGENVHDGPSRNPHNTAHMTGGSSGGSGGAVAGGLVPIALGSDTNGSIRVPASFCGLFGLKPTYGRLSRARTFPFVASLDHRGAAGAHRAGPGARLRRHAGPRCRGSRLHRASARAGAADDRAGYRRPAHRRRRRLFQARRLARGAGRRGTGRQGAGCHPRDRDPRGRTRPRRRLRHHHSRGRRPASRPPAQRARGISSPPSAIA